MDSYFAKRRENCVDVLYVLLEGGRKNDHIVDEAEAHVVGEPLQGHVHETLVVSRCCDQPERHPSGLVVTRKRPKSKFLAIFLCGHGDLPVPRTAVPR